MFGIDPNSDECDHRKGFVEVRNRRSGEWMRPFVKSRKTMEPAVHDCKHDAMSAVRVFIVASLKLVLAGAINADDVPLPDDFRFIHVDKEPDGLDVEVTDISHAAYFINRIKENIGGQS